VCAAGVGDCSRCFSQYTRVAGAKHEGRAFGREFFRNRAAESTTARSDEGDFVRESEIHRRYFCLR
jgi:hypothetical protein